MKVHPKVEHLEPIAYSPRQFAHACGISMSLLYKLWREGKGPPSIKMRATGNRMTGRRVIPREDGLAWLRSQQQAAE